MRCPQRWPVGRRPCFQAGHSYRPSGRRPRWRPVKRRPRLQARPSYHPSGRCPRLGRAAEPPLASSDLYAATSFARSYPWLTAPLAGGCQRWPDVHDGAQAGPPEMRPRCGNFQPNCGRDRRLVCSLSKGHYPHMRRRWAPAPTRSRRGGCPSARQRARQCGSKARGGACLRGAPRSPSKRCRPLVAQAAKRGRKAGNNADRRCAS